MQHIINQFFVIDIYKDYMSNIQTYKYTLMKKSSIIPKNQSIEKDTNLRVLKVKTDYSNRLQNESSTILTKNIEKIYTQSQYLCMAKKYEQQLVDLKDEMTKQRQILINKNEEYLCQLIEILTLISKNTIFIDEYLKLQRKYRNTFGRDLLKQYRDIKQKINENKYRQYYSSNQFSRIKTNIINPEASKENLRSLNIHRNIELKILPEKMLENLQINFYPIKNLKEKSNNSTKNVGKSIYGNESTHLLGQIGQKYKRCSEKLKKVQQVLIKELNQKRQNDILIEDLNNLVMTGGLELLNAKMKAKMGNYCY